MPLRQKKIRKAELLRCLPELSDTSDRDLVRLSRLFDEIDYHAGAVMIREGDIGQQAFLIVEGRVGVTLRSKTLAILEAGDIVGEMSLMDGEPRSATVTALTDVRALVSSRLDFQEFVEEPAGWRSLARAMSGRIRTVQPVAR